MPTAQMALVVALIVAGVWCFLGDSPSELGAAAGFFLLALQFLG